MAVGLTNLPDVQQYIAPYKEAAQTTGNIANQYQAAAPELGSRLRDALLSKLNYNQDLIGAKNTAEQQYFNAPSEARVQYQDIINPMQREKLVQQYQSNRALPYNNLTDLLTQRTGNIQDIIQAGSGAFQGAVQAQQGNAQLSRQNLTDAMQQYQVLQQNEQIAQALAAQEEVKRQNEVMAQYRQAQLAQEAQLAREQMANATTNARIAHSGSGGGGLTAAQVLQAQQDANKQEQGLFDTGRKQLQSGIEWGPVWNQTYQNLLNMGYKDAPETRQYVDNQLGAAQWQAPAAYQNYLVNQGKGVWDKKGKFTLTTKTSSNQ